MFKLYQFLVKNKIFFLFLFLEAISLWLIFKKNGYHGSVYFSTSNQVTGNLLTLSNNVQYYLSLSSVNQKLANENADLKEELHNIRSSIDTLGNLKKDSDILRSYEIIPARVVNNTTRQAHNYITINKGKKDGVQRGQGVVSHKSIVGKVKFCSENFATITSLLHTDLMISCKLKKSKIFGTVKWDGNDSQTIKLLYIPRHIDIEKGDTVVTSGYNSVFYVNELIGTIKDYDLKSNESFYDITVDLATDFNKLNYVYVIHDKLRSEKDSLEKVTRNNQ